MAFLVICVVAGGRAFLTPLSIVPLGLSGSFLLGVIVYTGAWQALLRQPLAVKVILAAIILLPALQLVPLPPSIWRALPGRELIVDAFDQAGLGAIWQPFTLAPAATLQTALQTLWLVALFAAVLPLSRKATDRLLGAVIILVVLHTAIGVVQVASRGSIANFLSSSDGRYLIGFFANKNHSALFLCFGAILVLVRVSPARLLDQSRIAITLSLVLVLIVATVATTSRAGILLMAATLIGLAFAFAPPAIWRRRSVLAGLVAAIAVLAAGVLSLRTTQTVFAHYGNAGSDMRFLFWSWSRPLLARLMPLGGGFGIFPDAFANGEMLAWVKPTQVNHVHNEYLEILIEGGVASIVLLLILALIIGRGAVRAWPLRNARAGREGVAATLIILLCAAHSLVDYPLRRMGIAAVFFIALALLLRVGAEPGRVPGKDRDAADPARD